jgi:thiamine biosynthesis lipoprotein
VNESDKRGQEEIGRKNRRQTLVIIGAVVVLLAIAFLVVRWVSPLLGDGYYIREPFQREEYILDDYITITAYGEERVAVEEAVDAAFAEISKVQDVADRYMEESEVSGVNAAAAAGPVAVSDELWEMITVGMEVYEESGGLFDITVGPLIDVWDVVGRSERGDPPPSQEEIDGAMDMVGSDKLVLDETEKSVYFTREGMILDLGGLAKGYALDRAAEALRSGGVEAAVINMISTSMTLGNKPESAGGPDWRIAVLNPRGEGYLAMLTLPGDTYISTSGDYQRFFEYGGVRYHHILDPRTGYPAREAMAVTLLGGRNGAWSDAMSTTAFIMGYPDGLDWALSAGGADGVMVDKEGAVHTTPGLDAVVETIEQKVGP